MGGASLVGHDVSGKKWEVDFDEPWGLGYDLFEADLDGNGYKDVLLLTNTAANGFLPMNVIYFVTFDSEGKPVPFRIDGYFELCDGGIRQLVDPHKDGKARLISQHYDNRGGRDLWDGYWVTDVYEPQNARWWRLNSFEGRNLPIFTYEKDYSEDDLIPPSETPTRGRRPFAPDMSTGTPVMRGKNISSGVGKLGEQEFFALKIKNSNGDTLRAAREVFDGCYLEDIIFVLDSDDGRRISFLHRHADEGREADEGKLLNRAHQVELYGRCAKSKLAPNQVWLRM